MTGYVRQSAASIVTDAIIEDFHFNNEFNQLEAAFSGVTGHSHDGSVGSGPQIDLTTSVTNVLPVANGGTGGSTQAAARAGLGLGAVSTLETIGLSDITSGGSGPFVLGATSGSGISRLAFSNAPSAEGVVRWAGSKLKTNAPTVANDATNKEYVDDGLALKVDRSGGTMVADPTAPLGVATKQYVDNQIANTAPGTVTSVGVTVPTGFAVSPSSITSSGTFAISYASGYQGYTTAEASKLSGIEVGATATPTQTQSVWNAGTSTVESSITAAKLKAAIETHAPATSIPVTSVAGKTGAVTLVKGDVGLGNVDNTSDLAKPISTATQTALNGKQDALSTVSQAEAQAGTATTGRIWTAQRVNQAIQALAPVGLYTGTSSTETNYPVGTIIGVGSTSNTDPALNSTRTIYRRNDGLSFYTESATATALSGTWRMRGLTAYIAANNKYFLYQRVA